MNDVAALMVDAAVGSLGKSIGAAAAADGVAIVPAVDPAAFEGALAARTMITGAAPGGLVTIVPQSGLQLGPESSVDPATLIDRLAAGAAAALGEVIGTALQVAPAEALAADPSAAGMASHIIAFSLGTSPNNLIPIYWVVEASLDALLTATDPVIPAAAAASSVAPANLPDLGDSAPPGPRQDLHLLSEVQMNVTVELGRAVMQVRDLLALREGSIVELDRAAGAAVDVLVNGTLVARGEVVVIDDELGVRVTELVER
jgi:flagellar motor switch protein FliN/FliY